MADSASIRTLVAAEVTAQLRKFRESILSEVRQLVAAEHKGAAPSGELVLSAAQSTQLIADITPQLSKAVISAVNKSIEPTMQKMQAFVSYKLNDGAETMEDYRDSIVSEMQQSQKRITAGNAHAPGYIQHGVSMVWGDNDVT